MGLDLTFKPFSGAGIVTMYPLVIGVPGGGFDLGEVPAFDISQSAPVLEMKTSRSSARGVAFRQAQSKVANLKMTLNTITDYTLGLLTSGVWTDQAASSAVTGWAAPTGLVVGNVIRLPARNVSALVCKDSTSGTPKTVPLTNFEIDLIAGTAAVKDITTGGAYVQPFKFDYTPGAISVLGSYKAPDTDFLVLLNGTNSYDGSRVILEAFKYRFAADGDSKWISEDFGQTVFNGSVLQDENRSPSSIGGQYYSLTKVGS